MLNIPEEIKNLIKQDGTSKNLRIHFPNGEHEDITNENIISDSFEFSESICSKSDLKFGLCENPYIEFETFNIGKIKGSEIECSLEIDQAKEYTEELESYYLDGIIGSRNGNKSNDGSLFSVEVPASLNPSAVFLRTVMSEEIPFALRGIVSDRVIYKVYELAWKEEYNQETSYGMTNSITVMASSQPEASAKIRFKYWQGGAYQIPLGKFIVDSCRKQFDMRRRDVIAYGILKERNDSLSEKVRQGNVFKLETAFTYDIVKRALSYIPRFEEGLFEKTEVSAVQGLSSARIHLDKFEVNINFKSFNIANNDKLYNCYAPLQPDMYLNNKYVPVSYENIYQSLLAWAKKYDGNFNEEKFRSDYDFWVRDVYKILGVYLSTSYTYNSTESYSSSASVDGSYCSIYAYETTGSKEVVSSMVQVPYSISIKAGGLTYTTTFKNQVQTKLYALSHPLFDVFKATEEKVQEDDNELYQHKNEWDAKGATKYLEAFVECLGCFGKTERSGAFNVIDLKSKFSALYPSETLYPSNDLYPSASSGGSVNKSEYRSAWYDDDYILPIGAVRSDYIHTDGTKRSLKKYASGYDSSTPKASYIIYDLSDNELIRQSSISKANMKAIEERFLSNASGISFMPAEITMQGRPDLEAGDVIEVTTADETITTVILSRTLSGIQVLTDSIISD